MATAVTVTTQAPTGTSGGHCGQGLNSGLSPAGGGRPDGELFCVTAPPKNSPAKLTRRPPEPIRPGGAVMSTMTLMAAQATRRSRRDRRN